MELLSEKLLYSSQLEFIEYKYDVEGFIWGEEMYDCTIHVYIDEIKKIPDYKELKPDLISVGLVFVYGGDIKPINCMLVRISEKICRDIYISYKNFNDIWCYLRPSVALRINIAMQKGLDVCGLSPDDILDFKYLNDGDRKAYLGKDLKVKFRTEKARPAKTVDFSTRRKQSLIDNPKNRYFYSTDHKFYHDKDCEFVKRISPLDFYASENMPKGYKACKQCKRKMYLRQACEPNVKEIPMVGEMLNENVISNTVLHEFVMDKKLHFHAKSKNELFVVGKEDTWIIKGFGNDKYHLWHNNYVKIGTGERYITEGFHNQKIVDKDITKLLNYISRYTFAGHLINEERKAAIKAAEEKARSLEEKRMKNLLYRLFKCVRRFFLELIKK